MGGGCSSNAPVSDGYLIDPNTESSDGKWKCRPSLDEAKERVEFVLSENAHFEKVYANYGYLLTLLGDLDKAILVYKKGVALNPDN